MEQSKVEVDEIRMVSKNDIGLAERPVCEGSPVRSNRNGLSPVECSSSFINLNSDLGQETGRKLELGLMVGTCRR